MYFYFSAFFRDISTSDHRYVIFLLAILLFITAHSDKSWGDERSDIRKEMQELHQQMESMHKRLEELEERNRKLEEAAREQVEEREIEKAVTGAEKAPAIRREYLGRAIQRLNPEISVIGIFSAAYYSVDDPIIFAEVDPQNTGVNLQELEISFQGVVDPYFRFDSFLSFTKDDVEIEEAYGTTLLSLPLNSQFRAGIMRSKFGRINRIHRHNQNFVTLPLVAAEFLGEHLNPTGIELDILPLLPWYVELSASINSPDVETPVFDRDENGNNIGRLLYVFNIDNFFEITDDFSLKVGGSYATGVNGTAEEERSNLFGLDLFAKWRPLRNSSYQELMFQTEWMWLRADTPEEKLKDYGFYAQLVYRFAKRWNAGLRYGMVDTDTPVNELETKQTEDELSVEALLTSLKEDNEEEESEILGLLGKEYRISSMITFNPSEFSRFRLEYNYTNLDFAENEHAIFLQFQYSIGAHGAHSF